MTREHLKSLKVFFHKASNDPQQSQQPYQEDAGSTFTHAGNTYDLNKLLQLTHSQKPQEFKVSDLAWVLSHDAPTFARVKTADLRAPILVYNDPKHGLTTVDGLHRLAKALVTDVPMLPGKLVTNQQLSQCLIGKAKVDKGTF